VFDRNQGAIGRAVAEADGGRAQQRAIETRVRVEVESAVRAVGTARDAVERFRASVLGVTLDLRTRATRAWQAGSFSIAELIDAWRAEWEARRQELELQRALALAQGDLAHVAMLPRTATAPTR
jgi:outer membrane protein TolC